MLLLITNDKGREFAVRFVDVNETYGLNFCLINNGKDKLSSGDPLVEFWDRTHPHEPVEPESNVLGQFTGGRYSVFTLLGLDSYGSGVGGLCLDGGNRDVWSVDEASMRAVRAWLSGILGRTPALV